MTVTRRSFLTQTGAFALANPFRKATARHRKRPNVVMIMADDHGAWASGAYGCPDIQTPTIDALARDGVRFTKAMCCTPVCSPSRMTYLTGLLPSTHGVQDYLLPEDSFGPASRRWLERHLTYTEVLANNGYTLGMCGKWHMGDDQSAQAGYSDWSTVPSGGGPYRNPIFVRNGVQTPVEGFREDAIGDFAVDFLERQGKGEKPFFLSVNFFAPHTPYDYQPEVYSQRYQDSPFTCFPTIPPLATENPELKMMFGKREPKQAYSALITAIDSNIEKILGCLQKMNLREDTLVIYTADHGWNAGHHGVWGKGNGTIPLNMFEESLRVPLIWNHPGKILPARVISSLVSSYDFFPTILEYLNIPVGPDPLRVGKSYAAFLRGESPQPRDRLYFEYACVRGVRTEKLKYIERADRWPSEMYDIEKDPGETTNVIDNRAYAAARTSLKTDLFQYFQRAGAPPIGVWRSTTQQHLPWETKAMGPGPSSLSAQLKFNE
jgi:arylsulfatase A-like enzyme